MPQVKINFNKMDESGLKSVVKKIEKKGMKVVKVEATNKARRESGYPVKNALFIFDSGQRLLVRVKSDGTVFQVKLNNKVLPIKHVNSMSKALDEIMGFVQANEKKYLKAKERRMRKKKLKGVDAPKVRTTRKQKIEQAEGRVTELEAEGAEFQQKIEIGQQNIETKTGQLEELQAKLDDLKERGQVLETELDGLVAEMEAA